MPSLNSAPDTSTLLVIGVVVGLLLALAGIGLFTVSLDDDELSVGEELFLHDTDPLDADTSGNGLLDHEAVAHGVDPTKADTLGNGLTDYEEIHVYGTDPLKEDTTGDGLSDYDEIHKYGTDPTTTDTTGDGLSDYDELHEYGTDPTTTDTTGDGLSDYDELHEYGTDPTTTDTTGDGLNDYDEIHNYGTDPTTTDTNGDGISDYDAINTYGIDPIATDTNGDGLSDATNVKHGADPLKEDTTGDGLSDYDEIHNYGTDPATADTTGDGLNDYDEIHNYGTDPTTTDTNGDGLGDAANIEHGADPHKVDTNDDGVTDAENVEYGLNPLDENTSGGPFSDYIAINAGDIDSELDALDPARKNIIIEVDSMDGYGLSETEQQALIDAFDDAPVENYDGSTGINLVLIDGTDDITPADGMTPNEYYSGVYSSHYEYRGYGAHHAFIVKNATFESRNVLGYHGMNTDGFVVEDTVGEHSAGATFIHELGHSLGLHPDDHYAIDSWDYSQYEYPSVMNYNYLVYCWSEDNCFEPDGDPYQFSTGDGGEHDHDDWEYILDNFIEETPDTSQLEQALGR